ncbi:MAG: arginase family protein [Candidatus Hecatellaceae archaeon]
MSVEPVFIDAPLDVEERESRIVEKRNYMLSGYRGIPYRSPYDGVMAELKPKIKIPHREHREFEVEPWLHPTPDPAYLDMVTLENFIVFIDADGCREYADKLTKLVSEQVLPGVPVLLGVDHSLSGGVVKALSRERGGENLTLLVLDSHFDVVTPTVRCGLIQYDLETNPETVFSPFDPFIRARPDSYNADSYLYYLVREHVIPPENLIVVGVSDEPPEHFRRVEDPRVKRFIEHYYSLVEEGATLITKKDVKTKFVKVRETLENVKTPYLYVSVDIDVGANSALHGARFLNCQGLSLGEINNIVHEVLRLLGRVKLLGLDLLETDVYRAGTVVQGRKDRTYEIEAELAARILHRAVKG